jgi:alkyl hydroperoxide reductase subunit D
MQTLEDIKNSIPDFAKDIRLNFSSVIINSSHDDDLVYGCAYACSLSLGNMNIAKIFEDECRSKISDSFVNSVKSIVSIMAMNNVWYKYRDAMPSMEMKVGPQKLRVNVMGTYAGLDKLLFESISLCISAVNGCQFCVKSHSQLLIDEGKTKNYVFEIGRIASVILAAEKSIVMNE